MFDRKSNASPSVCAALSGGDFVDRLERELADLYGRKTAVMCSADAALHTALYLCGAGAGDYVFAPTFTFYSYVSTVSNLGCIPVFIDCDPTTRCMSAGALETAFMWAKLQNEMPKAVVIDNAFGSVADYNILTPLCKSYDAPVIELACDALGGDYHGTPCGANGDYGVLCFGKRLGGGGGALVCSDVDDYERARGFSRAAYTDGENHDYRLHNVVAALDLALLGDARKITARARNNLFSLCAATTCVQQPTAGDAASFALCRAGTKAASLSRDGFDVKCLPPVHTLPKYSAYTFFEHEPNFCVSKTFSDCCLVGLDFSALKRNKLKRELKRASPHKCN